MYDLLTFIKSIQFSTQEMPHILNATWQSNIAIRKKHDWLNIKGASIDNLHGESNESKERSN